MPCVKDAILLLETGIFFQTVTFGITLHYNRYQLLACQSSFLEMTFVNIHIVFPVYLPQLIAPNQSQPMVAPPLNLVWSEVSSR